MHNVTCKSILLGAEPLAGRNIDVHTSEPSEVVTASVKVALIRRYDSPMSIPLGSMTEEIPMKEVSMREATAHAIV